MRIRVYYDCHEITGHHPGEETHTTESHELELPDGSNEKAIEKAICENIPRGGPLASYTFERYEIIDKLVCSMCKSEKIEISSSSQTDHHQQDFMQEYWDYKCLDCGHKWEVPK